MKFVFLLLFPISLFATLSLPLLLPDLNNDGFSDTKDFFSIINSSSSFSNSFSSFSLDEKSYFTSNLMTKSDLLEIFLLADTDSDGLISRTEWSIFYKTFFQLFTICDKNQNAKLNINEISCLMEKGKRKKDDEERKEDEMSAKGVEGKKREREEEESIREKEEEEKGVAKIVGRGNDNRQREGEKKGNWEMDLVKTMGLLKLEELNFIDYLFLKRFEYGWSKFQKTGSLGKEDFKVFLRITQYFYEFENAELENFFYLMIKYGRKSLEGEKEKGMEIMRKGEEGKENGRSEEKEEWRKAEEKKKGEQGKRVGLARVAYFLLGYNDYLKMQGFNDRKMLDLDDLKGQGKLFNQNYIKNNPFINDTIYSFGRLTFSDFFILNEY